MKMICNLLSFGIFFAICFSEKFGLEVRAQNSVAAFKSFDFKGERDKLLSRFDKAELDQFDFKFKKGTRTDEELAWNSDRAALAVKEHKRRVEKRLQEMEERENPKPSVKEKIEKQSDNKIVENHTEEKTKPATQRKRPTQAKPEVTVDEGINEKKLDEIRRHNEEVKRLNALIEKENQRIAAEQAMHDAQNAERISIEDAIDAAYKVKSKDERKKLYRTLRKRIEELVAKNGETPSDLRWSQGVYQKLRPLKQ